MYKRVLVLLPVCGIIAGCNEPTVPPASGHREGYQSLANGPGKVGYSQDATYWEEGVQTPPADAPPEYQASPSLNVHAYASFSSNMAIGESIIDYFGTSAIATVNLSVSKGDAGVQSPAAGYSERTDAFPYNRSLSAIAHITLSGSCGYAAHATATGKTWIGWGGSEWGLQGKTSQADASLPACSGSGGGGGGYILLICTTTSYYSGNGEYLGDSQECTTEEHYAM
jgi:hypothetical protein